MLAQPVATNKIPGIIPAEESLKNFDTLEPLNVAVQAGLAAKL